MYENLPDDIEGLVVMGVEPTSNAAQENLEEGDIILEVDREPVTTLKEFKEALARNTDRPVFMRVYKARVGQRTYIAVPR